MAFSRKHQNIIHAKNTNKFTNGSMDKPKGVVTIVPNNNNLSQAVLEILDSCDDKNDIPIDKAKVLLSMGCVMTHRFFTPDEHVFQRNFTMHFEDGCKIDQDTFWKDRQGIGFETGWKLK